MSSSIIVSTSAFPLTVMLGGGHSVQLDRFARSEPVKGDPETLRKGSSHLCDCEAAGLCRVESEEKMISKPSPPPGNKPVPEEGSPVVLEEKVLTEPETSATKPSARGRRGGI